MNSRIKFKIGPAARHCMKKTSPYTTLLIDITNSMTDEDVSKFKLAIQTEKLASKRQLCHMKHAAHVIAHLENVKYISKTCTQFLEDLLIKIGRKDILKLIYKYHEERIDSNLNENTAKKESDLRRQPFTKLRDLKPCNVDQEITAQFTQQTAVKEVYWNRQRSDPDGLSNKGGNEENAGVYNLVSSPMAIDNSQGSTTSACSQDSLKMSISDEEKLECLSDKLQGLGTYELPSDVLMSSQ